ncbi:MAG: 3-oxoacyl-ACP synthase III family protein [Bacteroidales bacterium]
MFINAIAHYLPKEEVHNDYFLRNGLTDEWIFQRTGIKTRKKASPSENSHTMGLEAVQLALRELPYPVEEVDLIIGATYSPFDTVGTVAHYVQQNLQIPNAAVVTVSSACSSFVNAVEVVEGYFASGKASKALVVASEHNTAYSNDDDEVAGHLWGDGASAVFISKEAESQDESQILEVFSRGHGHIGRGPEGVYLRPNNGGIGMPFGRDVFTHAIHYMTESTKEVLKKRDLLPSQLRYIIPHQANARIIKNVLKQLEMQPEQAWVNITDCGNTGCASTAIGLSQAYNKIRKNEYAVLTVFGGGYSSGAILIQR